MSEAERLSDHDDLVVTIDRDEYHAVRTKVVTAVEGDESLPSGKLLLSADGERRRWCAADDRRLVLLDAGPDDRTYQFMVSPRSLFAWQLASGDGAAAELVLTRDADGTAVVVLRGEGGEFAVDADERPFLDAREVVEDARATVAAQFVAPQEQLVEMLRQASRAPQGPFLDEDPVGPFCWMAVEDGAVTLEIDWGPAGTSRYRTPAATMGTGRVAVSPMRLVDLLRSLDPGPVTAHLPEDPSSCAIFEQPGVVSLLLPFDPEQRLREQVEEELEDLFGPDVLHRDADGDYPLSTDGTPVYARLVVGNPPRLAIFAVVVDEVEATEDLLAELNDLNAHIGFVRVALSDGAVVVAGDLVAATVDHAEIVTVHERVRAVADDVGSMLAVRFGGARVARTRQDRWNDYRATDVWWCPAEADPVPLTGPDAVGWPFGGPVVVLTAWNPDGRVLPDGVNHRRTSELVAQLSAHRFAFHWGEGRGRVTSHAEESVLVPDVDPDDLEAIALRFSQEAYFVVDEDTVRLVEVGTGRTEEWPRRG